MSVTNQRCPCSSADLLRITFYNVHKVSRRLPVADSKLFFLNKSDTSTPTHTRSYPYPNQHIRYPYPTKHHAYPYRAQTLLYPLPAVSYCNYMYNTLFLSEPTHPTPPNPPPTLFVPTYVVGTQKNRLNEAELRLTFIGLYASSGF